jgi:hypothetical protein
LQIQEISMQDAHVGRGISRFGGSANTKFPRRRKALGPVN